MTIEARAGTFRGRVRRKGRDLSQSFTSRADAVAWEAATVAALKRGEEPPGALARPATEDRAAVLAAPLTVARAAAEWGAGAVAGTIRTRHGRRYREGTLRAFEHRLRLHVLPHLGALPVATLTPGLLRRWLETLETKTSARTAAAALDALRPVLRRLVDFEVLATSPVVGVRPPSANDEARPVRFLTPAEGIRLREAAYSDREPAIGPLVDLLLATGLRRGEALALVWGPAGIDLPAGRVLVAASLVLESGNVGPTKSGRSRTVPLGPEVVARLREWRLRSGRPADGERAFPLDPRRPWARVREAAGLAEPLPGLHSLRHSAASWWVAAGLTLPAVAELLGHADAALVGKLYAHALPDEYEAAGATLEAFLAGASGA